jgi:hypothetical protein
MKKKLVVPHSKDEDERKRKRTRNTRNEAKHANSIARDFACFVYFRVFRVLLTFPNFLARHPASSIQHLLLELAPGI